MTAIVQDGDPVLRQTAQPVPLDEITGEKFQGLLARMHAALATQHDGVALAAPQIGESWRIFVVSPKAYADTEDAPLVFINPQITKASRKQRWVEEGCLSVRWLYGEAKRSTNITVTAYDEHGQEFTRGGGGLLAQIFQHEIDHLDGILFHDHARNLERMSPEEIERMHNHDA